MSKTDPEPPLDIVQYRVNIEYRVPTTQATKKWTQIFRVIGDEMIAVLQAGRDFYEQMPGVIATRVEIMKHAAVQEPILTLEYPTRDDIERFIAGKMGVGLGFVEVVDGLDENHGTWYVPAGLAGVLGARQDVPDHGFWVVDADNSIRATAGNIAL